MLNKLKKNMLIPHFGIALIILAFIFARPSEIFSGLGIILTSPSILLTDYVALAGIGATLFNAGMMTLFSYGLVKLIKMNITGPVFAGILTIAGFSFFGKNILNTSIIFLGVFLYSRFKKTSLRSVIVIMLFSSGLAPLSSLVIFGLGINLFISIPLGLAVGILSGFVIMELAPHVIKFHNGYDLYNVGFAGGIIAILAYSIINLSSYSYTPQILYTNEYHLTLTLICIGICLVFMISGFIANKSSFKEYKNILKKSGRAITDFTRKNREGIALFNSGFTGLLVMGVSILLGVKMSGPIFGAVLTVVGFGCFGKHPKNVWPPMLGVILGGIIFGIEFTSIGFGLALIFSTTLAPIAGEYGIIPGVIAGLIHLPGVMNIGSIHGGIILYSNGFAAAFVAVFMNMIMLSFERTDRKWQFMKSKRTSR